MAFKDTPDTSPAVTVTIDQLKDLIAEVAKAGRVDDGFLEKQAAIQAEAHARLADPSNKTHPGVSAFNPLGEREHPRPVLAFEEVACFGGKLMVEQLTWEELEAINRLKPGKYTVRKGDGTPIDFTVEHQTSVGNKGKLGIWYPASGEHKDNHRSLFDYCLDAIGQAGADTLPLIVLKQKLDAVRAKRLSVADCVQWMEDARKASETQRAVAV